MRNEYGQMVSFDDAISWVESIESEDEKKRFVLNRLRYERDQKIPVKPKLVSFRDKWRNYHTCGHCGYGLHEVQGYCPNCGFAIDWRSERNKDGEKENRV